MILLQGTCDKLPVEDGSVDVVTAVQAAHYFDLPAFFKEVSLFDCTAVSITFNYQAIFVYASM